ncbi:hypothetical protein GCM10017714_20730 [Curtobacterium pusillum]|uniref:Uncharacterized protein n=1 Tax=Curtobacterium pusillum TaxID=69373 RepID=A0ABX2MAE6_9MICO|nr:hypothetical protein [Curtobacterium pusillum]NUU14634.1 hypothetical protein [Curtobacterium pusillum]GLK31932.1 hypothetical protein GCM10017610_22170 [Curtobacterium pusillum]
MTISDLRTFATFDGHGGKVSKRVEVLDHEPSAGGPYEGLVAVRGEHPLGAIDERAADESASLARGAESIGWVDPATLRDWYRQDRVVVSRLEARRSGLEPGTYADSRGRGRVRIDGLEARLAPDGRPAFRALAGSGEAPVVDVPLPTDQAVRLVAVRTVDEGLEIVTTPVSPFLSPGRYPAFGDDVVGLPPRPTTGYVSVSAAVLLDGVLHEVERIDERAATIHVRRGDRTVPIAASAVGADLVRYTAVPA